jgi:MoaA/NifB/PqqE/SkfB family radical SAM enzyme
MLTAEITQAIPKASTDIDEADLSFKYKIKTVKGLEKMWFNIRLQSHLFILAWNTYGSLTNALKALKGLNQIVESVFGRTKPKFIKVDKKYYHHLYAPAYPSEIFDEYIKGEFNRIVPINKRTNALTSVILAITKKCPLKCEHCLEWDNLNKKESLELHHLEAIVKKFQKDGLAQFHFSGGEPFARIKDLTELIDTADKRSEFYVLTSGFNFTGNNARLLKQAGLTGVVISLDHIDAEKHNAFRGFNNSFEQVINALDAARKQNLVIALTICVTKAFISWDNLMRYAEFAKQQKVVFIQLLEPKAVGHYEGKDVFLNRNELDLLEKFYEKVNFDPGYTDYPIIIYHRYHQKLMGCMSGGDRGLYIDSEGYVNACPFCHTKNFNIKDMIEQEEGFLDLVKASKCPVPKSDMVC